MYPCQSPPHKKESNVGRFSRYCWSPSPPCCCQNWLCSAGNCFRPHPRTAVVRVRTSILVTSFELSASTADAVLEFSVLTLVNAFFASAPRHASAGNCFRPHPRTAVVRVRTSMLVTSFELSASTADAVLEFSLLSLASAFFASAPRHAVLQQCLAFWTFQTDSVFSSSSCFPAKINHCCDLDLKA